MQNFRPTEEITNDMLEAKKNNNIPEIKKLIVEMLLPEAYEIVEIAKKDITHKDGYASVWQFTSKLPKQYQPFFLESLAQAGYPLETIASIKSLMNN